MATNAAFEHYKQLYHSKRYDEALEALDRLMAGFPSSAALHWHRAACLEKLERHTEVPAALDRFLAQQPDYIPALLKRIEYTDVALDLAAPFPEDPDEEDLSAQERTQRQQATDLRERLAQEAAQRNERDLRQILSREPDHAQAMFLLAGLLRSRSGDSTDSTVQAEAHALLDAAVRLMPESVDYRRARADLKRCAAMLVADDDAAQKPEDPNIVRTFAGMCYQRDVLEEAAQDYRICWQQSGEARHGLSLATILHDLGQFDEALQCYDEVLATMAADDPRRELVLERRSRSENNGAGEREQLARLLLSSLGDETGKDRTHDEDIAAQALLGTAEAIRRGASVSEAVASNLSDDPDTMVAMNIARQILNVAHEPAPELVAINPADFPAFQRKHCDQVERSATRLGLSKIADAEARGMFNMLGSHVMLRIFKNDAGDIGLACFAMKPKWPGLLGFLFLLVTGKWKKHTMTECVTQFEDGSLITTQPENISPFEYGDRIVVIKLPAGSSTERIYQAHVQAVAEFRTANPEAKPMIVDSLARVEERWIAGQQSKAAYRKSIGYVSETELRRLLSGNYDRFADKIKKQLHLMAGA